MAISEKNAIRKSKNENQKILKDTWGVQAPSDCC
jgi:hypothetical protein